MSSLHRIIAKIRTTHLPKNAACGTENILIIQKIIDFNAPGSSEIYKITFLYMIF